MQCWGHNNYGQLGHVTPTDISVAVTVSGITDAIVVTAGGDHSCALLTDGTVQCWGNNDYGQLGNVHTGDIFAPVTVTGF